eukprot:UC1_evm2s2170
MMRIVFTCLMLAVCVTTAFAQSEPKFPVSWTATEEDQLAISQGGTPGADGLVCCSPDAPQCRVQTEYQQGVNYYDGLNNRTRFDSGGQSIVTDYNIGKQMLVAPNMTCLQYCPTENPSLDPSPFWPTPDEKEKVQNLGKVQIDGVTATHYRWYEKIAIVIKMQETNLYVAETTSDGYAVPVAEHDVIEPFNQKLGTSDTKWTNFKPGQPDPKLFKVVGISQCPESPNCGQNNLQTRRRREGDFAAFAKFHQLQ